MRAMWNGCYCVFDPIGNPENQHPLRSVPGMSLAPFHYISLRKLGMYKYTAAISLLYLLSLDYKLGHSGNCSDITSKT